MGTYFTRLLIIIITIILARFADSKAIKSLDEEQRAQLADVNAKVRLYHWAGLLAIVLLYYFNLEEGWFGFNTSAVFYGMALVAYIILTTNHIHKKLEGKNFPSRYTKLSLLAAATRASGVMLFFYVTN